MFKKIEILVVMILWIITPPIALVYELIFKPLGWIKTIYFVTIYYACFFGLALLLNYLGTIFLPFADVSDLSRQRLWGIILLLISIGVSTFIFDKKQTKLN
jgi:hypothetical protein